MDKRQVLSLFDVEVRANPQATPDLKVVCQDDVTRLEGAFNFICCWTFTQQAAMAAVINQARYFKQRNETLMWRIYDHDKPANLGDCLSANGFEPSPSGTLMVMPLENLTITKSHHDIRHVTTSEALPDYLAVAKIAFNNDAIGELSYFENLLSTPYFALFCGYADDEAAVSGLLQMAPNCSFGLLYGGGVSPDYRGKGFYRATVSARAAFAKACGLKYLATEARQSSRPILESLGFIPLVSETTWTLTANKE